MHFHFGMYVLIYMCICSLIYRVTVHAPLKYVSIYAQWCPCFSPGYIWKRLSQQKMLDDQKVFNRILVDYDMKWETSYSIHNSTFGQTHNGIRAVALDKSYSFRGSVSQVRKGVDTNKLVVLHPVLGHNLTIKMDTLHRKNLWQLRVSENKFFELLEDDNAGSGEQWFGRICKKKEQLKVSFGGGKRAGLV